MSKKPKNPKQVAKLEKKGFSPKDATAISEWSYKRGHYKNGRKKPDSRSKYT